jgi:hypothetical protein
MNAKEAVAGRPSKYPWDYWLNIDYTFILEKGKDFDSALHSMSMQIRQAARNRKKSVSVHIVENTLVVTVKSHA